jgi:hypothetical protein
MLPVVVQHGEVHRVDALEIFRIQHVLGAGARRAGRNRAGLAAALACGSGPVNGGQPERCGDGGMVSGGGGAPAVVVHETEGALAALALADPGRGVLLLSAPGAAGSLGAPWFLALVRQAVAATPPPLPPFQAALDCADAPGQALAALRAGARLLILDPACPAYGAVAAAAAETGAAVWPARPGAALDLRSVDLRRPAGRARLAAWLAGGR